MRQSLVGPIVSDVQDKIVLLNALTQILGMEGDSFLTMTKFIKV